MAASFVISNQRRDVRLWHFSEGPKGADNVPLIEQELTPHVRTAAFDGCCRKTILRGPARNIDSKGGLRAQYRFKKLAARIR